MKKVFLLMILCGELLAQNDMNIIRDPIYYYNSSGDSTWLDLGNPHSLSFDNPYRWRYHTTELMRLATDGKLGLGASSPVSIFHLNQAATYTAAGGLKITTTTTGQAVGDGLSLYFDSNDNLFFKSHQAGYISFQTDAAERFQITANGGSVFGSATGGDQGVGTINAKAVYDDGVLLTTLAVGGSTKQIQFNNAGSLDGAANFKWSSTLNSAGMGIEPHSAVRFRVRGAGNTSGTNAASFLDSDSVAILFLRNDRRVIFGSSAPSVGTPQVALSGFSTTSAALQVFDSSTSRFTNYRGESILYGRNGTGAGNFGINTVEAGTEIRVDFAENGADHIFSNTGLSIKPRTSVPPGEAIPVEELNIMMSDPVAILTDTDVNINVSTAAQAQDSSAIVLDASGTFPKITAVSATGAKLSFIGQQAANFNTGSNTNILWINASADTMFVKLGGNAFFVKLSDFGAVH